MMQGLTKQTWYTVTIEPFTWIVEAFFQPANFIQTHEHDDLTKRTISMLQLIVPLFLLAYAFLLIARAIRDILFFQHIIYVYNPFDFESPFLPLNALYFSIALAFIIGALVNTHAGIMLGIGSSVAFTILITFIRTFDPSFGGSYSFSLIFVLLCLLTGFTIGIVFALVFALPEGFQARLSACLIKSIGFAIVFLIIVFHLENASFSEFLDSISNNYTISAIIIGCVATGIALVIAGDVSIGTPWNLNTGVSSQLLVAATGGVIFGTVGVFFLIIIAAAHPSTAGVNNNLNLLTVSVLFGLTCSFLVSQKSNTATVILFGLAILIVLLLPYESIFNSATIDSVFSPGSPFAFAPLIALGLAFGIIGGSIIGKAPPLVYLAILVVELITVIMPASSGRVFGTAYINCILAAWVGGVIVSVVTNFIREDEKDTTRILAFIIAMSAADISIPYQAMTNINYGSSTTNLMSIIIISVGCFTGYMFICYRLFTYPISRFSLWRAYSKSQRDPTQTFDYLHHSVLYWAENIPFPLPSLRQSLYLALDQDVEQTSQEIDFILQQHPQQTDIVRPVLLEIALRDLETRDTMLRIALASQHLLEIFPLEADLLDPHWETPFRRLSDASLDAARFNSQISKSARYDALESMRENLKKVSVDDAELNKRLKSLTAAWMRIAQAQQEKLGTDPEEIGHIDNPYIAGQVLRLKTSLFVGRQDLVQRLEDALSKESHRATFFLTGERRMGKSSTLYQLPYLLGARYIPIRYDLQTSGLTASSATFLGALAKEISRTLATRGIPTKKLEYNLLQEAQRENEATPYYVFNEWLDEVQQTLKQQDRVLVLAFDEFEKLQEAEQDGYLNLRLLLDWFRSAIERYTHLAFIFSGIRTLSDMGQGWANYFVSVRTLKVSFLRLAEAERLIRQPIPGYPDEQIFGAGVVNEIIKVTGCHPFIVQAVCSALIDHLNATSKNCAELADVAIAVDIMLEDWKDTYFKDLWERTSPAEQTCLFALREGKTSSIQQLAERAQQNQQTVDQALKILLKRDLVLYDSSGNYKIAAPIFEQWVAHNSANTR